MRAFGFLRPRVLHPRSVMNRPELDRGKAYRLPELAAALKDVFFENLDIEKFLETYTVLPERALKQNPKQCFFLDPPYGKTKSYRDREDVLPACRAFFRDTEWYAGVCCTPEDVEGFEGVEQRLSLDSHKGFPRTGDFSHVLLLNFPAPETPSLFPG